jgi:hypothetical protein
VQNKGVAWKWKPSTTGTCTQSIMMTIVVLDEVKQAQQFG